MFTCIWSFAPLSAAMARTCQDPRRERENPRSEHALTSHMSRRVIHGVIRFMAASSTVYAELSDRRKLIVGDNIRRAREQQNVSQVRLAQLLDTGQRQISRWEKGHAEPNSVSLHHIALALERPLWWFYVERLNDPQLDDTCLPDVGEAQW